MKTTDNNVIRSSKHTFKHGLLMEAPGSDCKDAGEGSLTAGPI